MGDQKFGAAEERKVAKNVSLSSRLRRGSSSQGRLVELLRRTTTQRSFKMTGPEREYRLVSSGEDGMVIWWNLTAPYNASDMTQVDRSIM